MTDENDNRPGRAPLTLKPRMGSVSTGTVKQSFSHGRSKTVVVETKRRRVDAPAPNLAAPSTAEKRPNFDVRGPTQAPARPAPAADAASAHGLSEEERRARQRVIEARLAQERQNAERRERDEETRRREEDARRKAEEARVAAEAPKPPPVVAQAPAATPTEAPAPQPA